MTTIKSIEEKAKRYDEAIERAKDLHDNHTLGQPFIYKTCEDIFPELKENNDERVKKEIIQFLQLPHPQFVGKRIQEEWIAWLKRQGEQNPANKVEPKFKVGDWVAYNRNDSSREIIQVYDIRDGRYYFTDNVHFSWSVKECDEKCHLWTIQDAKDGDVLTTDNCTFIFKNISIKSVYYHCVVSVFNNFSTSDTGEFDSKYVHPATKEQRDLLFQKMKESGYEWDAEKKELKKIEQKPTYSEEDEDLLNNIEESLLAYKIIIMDNDTELANYIEKEINFLKSLKNRYT